MRLRVKKGRQTTRSSRGQSPAWSSTFPSTIIIQELAKELGITERRLNRCFMDHAAQTAYSYLKALRLQKGKQLLSQTNMTVTEIAGEAGWQNASKFAGAFRTKYGMTPIEYRKQNKFV